MFYSQDAFLITAVAGIFALTFFIQKQKLEEFDLFKDVFKDFNLRYDQLNEELDRIAKQGKLIEESGQDKKTDRQIVIDYFNLCSEEFLMYRQGYIPLKVWRAWVLGMSYYWSKTHINNVWLEEVNSNGSYYDFNPIREIEKHIRNN